MGRAFVSGILKDRGSGGEVGDDSEATKGLLGLCHGGKHQIGQMFVRHHIVSVVIESSRGITQLSTWFQFPPSVSSQPE